MYRSWVWRTLRLFDKVNFSRNTWPKCHQPRHQTKLTRVHIDINIYIAYIFFSRWILINWTTVLKFVEVPPKERRGVLWPLIFVISQCYLQPLWLPGFIIAVTCDGDISSLSSQLRAVRVSCYCVRVTDAGDSAQRRPHLPGRMPPTWT